MARPFLLVAVYIYIEERLSETDNLINRTTNIIFTLVCLSSYFLYQTIIDIFLSL